MCTSDEWKRVESFKVLGENVEGTFERLLRMRRVHSRRKRKHVYRRVRAQLSDGGQGDV